MEGIVTSKPSDAGQIAARLRAAREQSGLYQGQVARMLDMHRPTISEIEAGRRRVSAQEIQRFASIYGVSVEWLLGGRGTSQGREEFRVELAARELAKLKDEDLQKVLDLLSMLRRTKE